MSEDTEVAEEKKKMMEIEEEEMMELAMRETY